MNEQATQAVESQVEDTSSPCCAQEGKACFDKVMDRLSTTGITVSFKNFHAKIPGLDLAILTTAMCVMTSFFVTMYVAKRMFH